MERLRITTFVGGPDEELIKGNFVPIMKLEENLELQGCLWLHSIGNVGEC